MQRLVSKSRLVPGSAVARVIYGGAVTTARRRPVHSSCSAGGVCLYGVEEPVMFVAHDPTDELVKCPFNDNHILLRSRIHYHLVKCGKKCPNCNKIICPYDATEYLEPENFEKHLTVCKEAVAGFKAEHNLRNTLLKNSRRGLTPAPFQMPFDPREMWDSDDDDTSKPTESSASSTQPIPPDIMALRHQLARADFHEPKKPIGRGAILKKLLGKE